MRVEPGSRSSSMIVKMNKELHHQVRIQAAIEGITLREYVIGLLEKDLKAKGRV